MGCLECVAPIVNQENGNYVIERKALVPDDRCMIWLKYSEADLSKKIEELRGQLVKLAGEKGFANEEVIHLSQHLDEYIIQAQNYLK